MTEAEIAHTRAVIEADCERVDQAYEAGHAELGHPPCWKTKRKEHRAHSARLVELAAEKFARLI